MRKIHVLIPSLVATAGMPFVTLVGCGGDTPQPGNIEFSTSEGQMTSTIEGTFDLDWTPIDHSLIIDPASLKFESNAAGEAATVTTSDSSARPQQITITLQSEYSNDITDGKLTFKYEDKTTKQKDIAGEVRDIHITGYIPPPPPAPVEFYVSDGQMVKAKSGTLKLNANPSDHELEFHGGVSWTFTSESAGNAYHMEYNPQAQIVTMYFVYDIPSDIDDGVLSFVYDDKTTGVDNISVTIENVHLDAYVPPTPPPGRINFNTCSWEEIYDECRVYEASPNPYYFIEDFYFEDPWTHEYSIPTSIDDFIGQQRIIHLDSMLESDKYYVNVLGIGQDYISVNPNTPAAITFQFDRVIGCGTFREAVQWNDTLDNNYWDSYINQTILNDELLSRIKDFTATSYIKPVYRTVASNDGLVTRQQVYCFMPLLSNIFSSEGLTKSFSDPTPYIDEGQTLFGSPTIQSQYPYYRNEIYDKSIFNGKDNFDEPTRIPILRKTFRTKDANYWLTTSLMNDSTDVFTVHYFNASLGEIHHDVVTTADSLYVAPCFCV